MDYQYLGDNFIPGVNVKNINNNIINPLMQLGGQIGSAYDQYGQGLRRALYGDQDKFAQQFLAGKLPGQKPLRRPSADLRGSITPGSMQPAANNLGEGAAMDAAERFRPGAGYPMGVIRPDDYPELSKEPEKTPDTSAKTGPKLDPNATERFKTAFNAGNNNMDQIQAMYADRPDLQEWAKANPALAQKEYLKKAFNTDGTPKILDKTAEGFDKPNAPGVVESIDGMQLPNSISINAANELLDNMSEADDNQAFLKNYIMAMQNN
jgi:hypothetical protein